MAPPDPGSEPLLGPASGRVLHRARPGAIGSSASSGRRPSRRALPEASAALRRPRPCRYRGRRGHGQNTRVGRSGGRSRLRGHGRPRAHAAFGRLGPFRHGPLSGGGGRAGAGARRGGRRRSGRARRFRRRGRGCRTCLGRAGRGRGRVRGRAGGRRARSLRRARRRCTVAGRDGSRLLGRASLSGNQELRRDGTGGRLRAALGGERSRPGRSSLAVDRGAVVGGRRAAGRRRYRPRRRERLGVRMAARGVRFGRLDQRKDHGRCQAGSDGGNAGERHRFPNGGNRSRRGGCGGAAAATGAAAGRNRGAGAPASAR